MNLPANTHTLGLPDVAREVVITFLVSFFAGALIWALSPWMSGKKEPWDAENLYYEVALVVAGFLCGVIRPQRWWIHYFGIFFGQLAFMLLFLPTGPLMVLGIGFLAIYSIIALIPAAGGAGVRGHLK